MDTKYYWCFFVVRLLKITKITRLNSPLRIVVLFLSILLGITYNAVSQYTLDSLDLDQDVSVWFDDHLGRDHTYLVSGCHKRIFLSRNSYPFYKERGTINGTISYKNQVFKDVDMIYDIYEDFVAITNSTEQKIYSPPVFLDQPGVDWFEISGSLFRNFHEENGRKGYYQILVDGSTFSLVSKRSKLKETNSSSRTVEFVLNDSYHLFIGEKTFSGRRKSSFIKAFPNLKKSIKLYVKSNRLRIGLRNENDIIQLAKYCDQLIRNK